MHQSNSHILLFLLALLVLQACGSQEICDEDSQSWLAARFRTLDDGEIVDTTLSFVSIWGIRDGEAGALIYSGVQANRILLPLDPSSPESCFVFTDTLKTDTLCIGHEMEAYLISENCGFAGRYTIQEVQSGGSMIKDVEIIAESVDAEYEIDEENIWIYF